jgi:MFS family permease
MSVADHPARIWRDEISTGWLVLLTSLVGIGAGATSLLFYSVGVFFEPLQREFGWTRGQIAGAMIYLTVGLVISGPVVGWLIDRFGARVVALVSIPLLALTLGGFANLGNSLPALSALFLPPVVLAQAPRPSSIRESSTEISWHRAVSPLALCWRAPASRRWCCRRRSRL